MVLFYIYYKIMDYEEKLKLINECLDLDRDKIDYGQVVEQVKSLMNEVPDLKLGFQARAQCFGNCFGVNKTHDPKDLIQIPSDSHSYCMSCLSAWVTSSFFSNPFFPIYCQHCFNNSTCTPIPEPLYLNSIIPSNVYENYKTYFKNLSFNCTTCQYPFKYYQLCKFSCGHYFCPNDVVNNVLNQYINILKGKSQVAKDTIEFEISCTCNNSVLNDAESLNAFNQLAQNLNQYSTTFNFYRKHLNFFLRKSKLIRLTCCSSFKEVQENEEKELNCMNCCKCAKCSSAIHTGLSCEEFNEMSCDYLNNGDCYDMEREFNRIYSGVREYLKDVSKADLKFVRLVNRKLDIVFRFRKVWEFGFVALDGIDGWQDQVKEKFENGFELFKYIQTDFKAIAICEIHGERLERQKTLEGEVNDNIIYDLEDRYKVKSEKQIRFLYLIGRS